MATTKPKAASTCRLTLTIAGVDYRVRPATAPEGYRRAFELTRDHPKLGKITHVVAVSAAGSSTCDCQAFEYRRDRSDACKHQKAARAVGLI